MKGTIPLEGVTALTGPSGSGKTTLLRMLAGLEPRARGEVRFGDTVWSRNRRRLPPEARGIGMVFQDARLFGHLTVGQNIGFGAARRGISPAAVTGIVDGLGLGPMMDRRPATLSGGETRRVALARALASGPQILFLDEPLSALDDDTKSQVLPYLTRAVSGSGIPVLYVTHSREEVTRFADRVLRIRRGSVLGWDTPPVRLNAEVTHAEPGRVRLDLGGTGIVLPGHGRPGDARAIGIPEGGLLVSVNPPGASGALAVLQAVLVEVRPHPSGPELVLETGGQRIFWRVGAEATLSSRLPGIGGRVWLSILSAFLR